MRTSRALPLLALALAACQAYSPEPYPEPYPPQLPPGQAQYRAIGTEPFWDLEIGRDLVFTDRGVDFRVIQPTPRAINGTAGEIYRTQRIEANIVHSRCSDGMSDRTYPDTVHVRVDGRNYRGCGAPIGFFSQIGETGQPHRPGPAAMDLKGSNWRVAAINGRSTPPRNFYLNFMPDRIDARFGCNSMGASYVQAGNIVSAGAVTATQMACPDMSFESQGSAVLQQPMTVSGMGEQVTLSNSRGSIELVRAN
ncbi:MAG TPA: META domain-containing protein [Sphingomicrobium sp.]|nr:META domain-containing protein [Sphingomicrobium sp.]